MYYSSRSLLRFSFLQLLHFSFLQISRLSANFSSGPRINVNDVMATKIMYSIIVVVLVMTTTIDSFDAQVVVLFWRIIWKNEFVKKDVATQ